MSPSSPATLGERAASPGRRPLPARTRLAVAGARLVAAASRRSGLGAGGIIGGRLALRLSPSTLRDLGRDRTVVLVTGTNGKTTTSLMLSRIFGAASEVAANADGANMPDGVAAALAARPDAPVAVLEVDEGYVPTVATELRPDCLVLLNLSRDQLDRVGEVRATERDLRAAIGDLPETTVVANCDDPLVTSAALAAKHTVWVAAGQGWHQDALACARCGQATMREDGDWRCTCGFARPAPHWTLEGDVLESAAGGRLPLGLQLPGRANAANAAMAVATAVRLGLAPDTAIARLRSIDDVAGRYLRVQVAGRTTRLLLAKNPAGWRETLDLLDPSAPVVVAVNGREADGRDLSWLWDVPFEKLHGRPVVAAGERAADLAVRLTYAEIPHITVRDPLDALPQLPPGPPGQPVELVANYTAFRALHRRLTDG